MDTKKIWGVTGPEKTPCLPAWTEPSQESLPLGALIFVQGG